MNLADLIALSPFITLAATAVVIMLCIALYRNHGLTVILTLSGLAVSATSFFSATSILPRQVTLLLTIDQYAFYYTLLIILAASAVTALSYGYIELHEGHREEFYLLLLLATLGCAVLASASHFASFFLGLELLSVSLYALAAYLRHSERGIEAGVKYLILAAVSSAFILFGMALVYAGTGTMEFSVISSGVTAAGPHGAPLTAGLALIIVGLGFKLAVVPFHMWTPDVYEGAPAPITAFIATVSKGAVFALVLRFFTLIDIHGQNSLLMIFTSIAIASMFFGNLLALFQKNVKRILAYSSISHLGYLLVTLLASGPLAAIAATFYLTAYFITTLGAFGVITMLSGKDRDADSMEDYQGLAWQRPWLAGVFIAMLLSLAGIPLTAGFIGKFLVVTAGVGSSLWLLVAVLVINSAIGLVYYLRIIATLFGPAKGLATVPTLPLMGSAVLAVLTVMLVWLGTYPGPVIDMIKKAMTF